MSLANEIPSITVKGGKMYFTDESEKRKLVNIIQ